MSGCPIHPLRAFGCVHCKPAPEDSRATNAQLRADLARVTAERDEAKETLRMYEVNTNTLLSEAAALRAVVEDLADLIREAAPVSWTAGTSDAAYEWEKRAGATLADLDAKEDR